MKKTNWIHAERKLGMRLLMLPVLIFLFVLGANSLSAQGISPIADFANPKSNAIQMQDLGTYSFINTDDAENMLVAQVTSLVAANQNVTDEATRLTNMVTIGYYKSIVTTLRKGASVHESLQTSPTVLNDLSQQFANDGISVNAYPIFEQTVNMLSN